MMGIIGEMWRDIAESTKQVLSFIAIAIAIASVITSAVFGFFWLLSAALP